MDRLTDEQIRRNPYVMCVDMALKLMRETGPSGPSVYQDPTRREYYEGDPRFWERRTQRWDKF
jgi:hypothetical protein